MLDFARVFVKWIMLHVLSLGSASRYTALRGRVTLTASKLGLYERRHLRFMREVIRPGDVAIDVGASFGAYTQDMADLVGPAGHVYGFEPNPDVFEVLERGMRGRANVELRQVALSDRIVRGVELRMPVLWGTLPEPALATLEPLETAHRTYVIDLTTLDQVDLEGVRFIKVDVEGHEAAFLRGAAGTIERDRPVVQVESNDIEADEPVFRAFAEHIGYDLKYLDRHGQLVSYVGEQISDYNFYLVPDGWSGRTA